MANAANSHEHHVTAAPAAGPAAIPSPHRRGDAHQPDPTVVLNALVERAHAIAKEASSTLVSAFKDVMADPAVSGGFAVESARDLIQYLSRRGELAPLDAERLVRLAESGAQRIPDKRATPAKSMPAKPGPAKSAAKAVPMKATAKPASKPAAKPVSKAAAKSPAKSAAKSAAPSKKAAAPATKGGASPRQKKARR